MRMESSDIFDGFKTQEGASDVYYDPPCETCNEDGRNMAAVGFCLDCNTFLCHNCLKVHSRLVSSKKHPVLQGNDMPKSLSAKPVKYPECSTHTAKKKERFCLNHRELVCDICQENDHALCDVRLVTEICESFDKTNINKAKNVISKAQEKAMTVEECLKSVSHRREKSRNFMLSELEDLYNKATDIIKRMYNETKEKIDEIFSDQELETSKQGNTISGFRRKFQAISDDIDKINAGKLDARAFIHYQELVTDVNESLRGFNASIVNLESSENSFTVSEELKTFLLKNFEFGMVSTEKSKIIPGTERKTDHTITDLLLDPSEAEVTSAEEKACSSLIDIGIASPESDLSATKPTAGLHVQVKQDLTRLKVVRREKLNVSIEEDKLACHITGIAVKSNGDVLVIDWSNDRVKLFSLNGKLLSFLDLASLKLAYWPSGLCFIDDETAVVCLTGTSRLHILKLSNKDELKLKGNINLGDKIWSVAPDDGGLVVACGPSHSIIKGVKLNGEVNWTIETDKHGQKLFVGINYVCTFGRYSRKVIVAENKVLSLLNADTEEILENCEVKEKYLKQIVADNMDYIYVSYSTGDIDVWSENLSQSTCLLNDCKREPTALAYNSHEHGLCVSYQNCDTVERLILQTSSGD